MTDIDTDRLAAEMLAGLEGVTPGPWECQPMLLIASDPDAAHIARCDPDSIRALLSERANDKARIAELGAVVEWYGEQARLARLIHSGGDAGRHSLAEDGGKRARKALGGDDAT